MIEARALVYTIGTSEVRRHIPAITTGRLLITSSYTITVSQLAPSPRHTTSSPTSQQTIFTTVEPSIYVAMVDGDSLPCSYSSFVLTGLLLCTEAMGKFVNAQGYDAHPYVACLVIPSAGVPESASEERRQRGSIATLLER